MWKLNLPDVSTRAQEFLDALCDARGKKLYPFSKKQEAALLAAYDRYDAASGRASRQLRFKKLGKKFLEAMGRAYDQVQEGKRLNALRARLKLGVRKCPYCGFGEISDLDHHLPRSTYRAFAIYARNLIPCCHPCNNKKRAIAGDTPDAHFIHVYFDAIPIQPFLVAEVSFSESALLVSFSIVRCQGMDKDLFDRLRFQFRRLDLNTRYQPEVTEFMNDNRAGFEVSAAAGAAVLENFIASSHANALTERGANHWKTALWAALLASDEFKAGGYKKCFGVAPVL